MDNNFTLLWQAAFSWIGTLLNLKLPIYLGNTALSTLDIIIGTFGIFVAIASIRALVKSGFTIAGKDIVSEYNHQKNINALNEQTHAEYISRQEARKSAFMNNATKNWDSGDVRRLK